MLYICTFRFIIRLALNIIKKYLKFTLSTDFLFSLITVRKNIAFGLLLQVARVLDIEREKKEKQKANENKMEELRGE
jgi:hypothetical protein